MTALSSSSPIAVPSHTRTSVDPRLVVLVGAVATSLTGCFTVLSGAGPATSTFYRCALGLPVLGFLAWREYSKWGRMSARTVAIHLGNGALLGVNFAIWAQSMTLIGAGISTVIANMQVVVVPALAWIYFRAKVTARFAMTVPLLLFGVALACGALGGADGNGRLLGTALALGSGVSYGIYLFVVGYAGSPDRAGTEVFLSTSAAGIVGAGVGAVWSPIDLLPGVESLGWLALIASAHVIGWLAIGYGLPRMSPSVGSALLLAQPVLAVGAAMVLLGERPGLVQLAGCAIVLAAVWLVVTETPTSPER